MENRPLIFKLSPQNVSRRHLCYKGGVIGSISKGVTNAVHSITKPIEKAGQGAVNAVVKPIEKTGAQILKTAGNLGKDLIQKPVSALEHSVGSFGTHVGSFLQTGIADAGNFASKVTPAIAAIESGGLSSLGNLTKGVESLFPESLNPFGGPQSPANAEGQGALSGGISDAIGASSSPLLLYGGIAMVIGIVLYFVIKRKRK